MSTNTLVNGVNIRGTTQYSIVDVEGGGVLFDPNKGIKLLTGEGTPEGVVTANEGRHYQDTNGGALYYKTSSGDTNTGWLLLVGGAPLEAARNVLINGDFRINERVAASKTATVNAYNYDRWYYDGTNLIQPVEDINYTPSTVYTLSGINVTTQQLTSPASGHWNITVPTNANNVQLEEGTVATKFEKVRYQDTLAYCRRYYVKSYNGADAPGTPTETSKLFALALNNSDFYDLGKIVLPVKMRAAPAVTIYSTTGTINAAWDRNQSADRPVVVYSSAESIVQIRGTSFTPNSQHDFHYVADAEITP
jgi:hypothetical protein